MTLYFVCLKCEDKFLMDEDYVEVASPESQNGNTIKEDLSYTGKDCLCPICDQFTGQLVDISNP